MPYFSSAWKVPSGSAVVTRAEPRTDCRASPSAACVAPNWVRTVATSPPCAASASSRCSAETNSSERSRASRSAAPSTASRLRDADGADTEDPVAAGSLSTSRVSSVRSRAGSAPTACSSGRARVSASSSSATPRWAGSTAGLPRSAAVLTALLTACVLRVVMSMRVVHLIEGRDVTAPVLPSLPTRQELSLFHSSWQKVQYAPRRVSTATAVRARMLRSRPTLQFST